MKPQRGSNKSGSLSAAVGATGADQKEEVAIYPPPKLGQFYDFFSFSHLTPPLQYIRRSVRPFVEDKRPEDFFQIDVRFCNGKLVTIVACRNGFYPAGKRALTSHSLVGLLLQICRSFDGAYKSLMKAFVEHNKAFKSFIEIMIMALRVAHAKLRKAHHVNFVKLAFQSYTENARASARKQCSSICF